MPKGGSGFSRGAGSAARAITRGASKEWRLANPDKYTKEIQDIFKSMYRSGVVMVRDSRGTMKEIGGSDAAIDRAMAKTQALAQKMAEDVQIYSHEMARLYNGQRQAWGRPVYVNSREMEEFRRGIQSGDRMLINPRGRYGIDSDAAIRASETGWRGGGNNNVDILLHANRTMNATRSAIWQNASKAGATEHYASEIFTRLWERYNKTERGAWRRRKK